VEPYSDIVVTQESASTLTALETSTGQVRWTTDLTGPLTKWTGIVREPSGQGRLLVSSESEMFLIAPDTGNLVGRERFERVVSTPPLLAGPMAAFGTATGVVQAHLVGRHVSAWNFGTRGAFDTPLLMVGGYICGIAQSGDVVYLTTNGDLVGRGRILAGLDAPGTTDGVNLYLAGRDQSVWAFDAAGRNLWRYRTSNPLSKRPAVANGTLYVDLGAESLTAFDAASGAVKWRAKDVHGEVILIRNGRLLVWDGRGVSLVEPSTGDRLARVELPGVVRLVPDAMEDGHLYAVSSKGVFAKFTPR
jgi:outer membrane protein assembly factor BamB